MHFCYQLLGCFLAILPDDFIHHLHFAVRKLIITERLDCPNIRSIFLYLCFYKIFQQERAVGQIDENIFGNGPDLPYLKRQPHERYMITFHHIFLH